MADAFAPASKSRLTQAGKKVMAANRVQDTEAKPKFKKKRKKKLPDQKVIDKRPPARNT